MLVLRFLSENGVSSTSEIAEGINAYAEQVSSGIDSVGVQAGEVEEQSKKVVTSQNKPVIVKVTPKLKVKRGNLYKLGEKLPDGTRKISVSGGGVYLLCKKLSDAGVLNMFTTSLSKGMLFFEISKEFPTEQAFESYYRHFSMQTYRFVPYQGVLVSELMKSREFLDCCAEFVLTPDEGINALKGNQWKVSVATFEGKTVLSRKL
jgi:hypothetical protein